VALRHHELCFGCGRTNLFGLLAEIEQTGPAGVTGRCFIKQDHQGEDQASAHPGVVAAALLEALTLASGRLPARVEIEFLAAAPVGGFLELEAEAGRAAARAGDQLVATLRA
jgi:hypothetical protein